MFKFLFFPFSILFGLMVFIRRNVYYGLGLKKRRSFDFPIICIGNLSMGGTGKTPHTEYLVRWLKDSYHLATLSRGYKRKTSGYICANNQHTVHDIGDEPLQYFTEFKGKVIVAVDEKRVRGVENILNNHPETDIVILDDAYQHLAIRAGYNILLTDYFSPYFNDYLFPMGRLRENRKAINRADVIIVTKCPRVLSPITRDFYLSKLKGLPNQKILFSYLTYGKLTPITQKAEQLDQTTISQIILLTGIANPYPLKEHLMNQYIEIHPMEFPDHHTFAKQDIEKIKHYFSEIITSKKAIITTQKDAMRLLAPDIRTEISDIPIYYIPLEVQFHDGYEEILKEDITKFIINTTNSKRPLQNN